MIQTSADFKLFYVATLNLKWSFKFQHTLTLCFTLQATEKEVN